MVVQGEIAEGIDKIVNNYLFLLLICVFVCVVCVKKYRETSK